MEQKQREAENKKRKAKKLNQELLEEVRAVSEGKNLKDFRKEKEQRNKREIKLTRKQQTKEEVKERKNQEVQASRNPKEAKFCDDILEYVKKHHP